MPQKHHYIPQFYLKQWSGNDGRLCEYSKPHHETIGRMKHPAATGYSRGLYTIAGAPPNLADVFENKFLSIADGQAAHSLKIMVNDHLVPSGDDKAPWTRFIMSLWYRTPEGIARSLEAMRNVYLTELIEENRERYPSEKRAGDPETIEGYVALHADHIVSRTSIDHLMSIIQSDRVREKIMGMQWHVARFHNTRFPLLTSDRPIVMTNGITYDNSHIVMPLSPRHIFFAANTDEAIKNLKSLGEDMLSRMNDRIVRQARRFVYGIDDKQLRFVANRLGEKARCSPFE
jgi:hypothetical protein